MSSDLQATPASLRNSRLRVQLGPSGPQTVHLDDVALLGDGGMFLELREDISDAWSFGINRYRGPVVATFTPEHDWIVAERGPLRARVWTEGWIGRSRVRWTLSMLRDDPRLFIEIEILYADRHRALQLKVPLAGQPGTWTCGLPGGHINRDPGAQEWPMHAWVGTIPGPLRTAVIGQDCYSTSFENGCWRFTLLRSPRMGHLQGPWEAEMPERETQRAWHTDQGQHAFAFTLLAGDDIANDVLHREARQLAQPPIVFDRYEGLDRPPWGKVPPRHLR